MAFLRRLGYRVTLARDGRAAVAAHRATPADLVLIDMALPELEAIEVTHCIKQLSGARWVPVVLMTASSSKEDIVAVLNAGADDTLTKPVVFEVLAARLRSLQRIAVLAATGSRAWRKWCCRATKQDRKTTACPVQCLVG